MRQITLILCLLMAGCGESRADTTKVLKREICRIDTIYVDDPRCDTIPRARGLDSMFVLGHDSTYKIGDEEAMKNQNMTDLYILKDTTVFVSDPHWVYFNWSNGKRVNMRKVK